MKRRYRWIMGWAFSLGILVGCSSPPVPEIDTSNQASTIAPTRALSYDLGDGYYQTALPYVASPTRGLVYSYINNSRSQRGSRYDIEELELSLMRASTNFFDPEHVYFQDGQYLTRELVIDLLKPQKTEDELAEEEDDYVDIGLNPLSSEEIVIDGNIINNLNYLAYLLEQNFITFDENEERVLEGISIGLALNSFQGDGNGSQALEMNEDDLIVEGEKIAQRLVEILRTQEGLESVPIMIGLYILESVSAVVPGRLVSKTLISETSANISNWEPVNERFYLLSRTPDSRILEVDLNLIDEYTYFQKIIDEYYPHNHGIIGIAHFIDNSLYDLQITINTEVYGLSNKKSLHQIIGEVIAKFSPNYDVTVEVRSSNEVYGIIKRPANGEVFIHRIGW